MKEKKHINLFGTLKDYWKSVVLLAFASMAANGLTLFVPRFISQGIDTYTVGQIISQSFYTQFFILTFFIFLLTYFQGIFQTYVSEKAAFNLRQKLADKISRISYADVENETHSKLLTNFTADIDGVKMFYSMAVATIISSIVLIFGASTLLIMINWKLALAVLAILPVIGVVFALVFKKLGPLFTKSQSIIDSFNSIIGESIVGAAAVRVLNLGQVEKEKYQKENDISKDNSMMILKSFSFIVPIVGIIANLASLLIVVLGGKFVIGGTMSLGNFTAFNSYVIILIFPIIMLGFISSIISRAQVSYARIQHIFDIENEKEKGTLKSNLLGKIEVANLELHFGETKVLDDVSFIINPGTKNAIIGPTSAGKTQLLQILVGLTSPTKGSVFYDDKPLDEYTNETIHSQVAFVFQDSVMFNLTIRENISFSKDVESKDVEKAIATAELSDFISELPDGLDTVVSERGSSLSGGQKQRIMLARALSLNPKILFLDDFTARVDASTEKKILTNIENNYPGITLISVTQKINSVEHYEKIILLMEGEKIAEGTHEELAQSSLEYMQIMESQKSTESYE